MQNRELTMEVQEYKILAGREVINSGFKAWELLHCKQPWHITAYLPTRLHNILHFTIFTSWITQPYLALSETITSTRLGACLPNTRR